MSPPHCPASIARRPTITRLVDHVRVALNSSDEPFSAVHLTRSRFDSLKVDPQLGAQHVVVRPDRLLVMSREASTERHICAAS